MKFQVCSRFGPFHQAVKPWFHPGNQFLGASKNRGGPPKWMVKIMENPIKMDDLGVPLFLETPVFRSIGTICGGLFPKMYRGQICNLEFG